MKIDATSKTSHHMSAVLPVAGVVWFAAIPRRVRWLLERVLPDKGALLCHISEPNPMIVAVVQEVIPLCL